MAMIGTFLLRYNRIVIKMRTVLQADRTVKDGIVPKQVDHELRRAQIIQALWRIAADSGLEAASLSHVAAEAGVSKGMVQHYFSSKEELFSVASGHLKERIDERLQRFLGGESAPMTPLEVLRAVLVGLLPIDEGSRVEALVENAFFIRALKQPQLASRFREGRSRLLELFAEYIRSGQQAGELRDELDPAYEAEILLATAGGLGESLLLGYHTPDSANTVLGYLLQRMVIR